MELLHTAGAITQINKEAGLMVFSWVKEPGLANPGRSSSIGDQTLGHTYLGEKQKAVMAIFPHRD